MSIFDIIEELNLENGSNYKKSVLQKHSDNDLLKRALKMTYDRVVFTYGISMRSQDRDTQLSNDSMMSLSEALDILETEFATRKVTGHDARDRLEDIRASLNDQDRTVVEAIINRDLRINTGRTNINKVFKNLITKPVYMRCGLYNKKAATKINPKDSIVQLKADGTYRDFTVENGSVLCNSRSGEVYEYPVLNTVLETYPDGHYIGELTVVENGKVLDRATGNGMINSDAPPHENIVLDLWDYVTLEEYMGAADKIKGKTPYWKRLHNLEEIVANGPKGNVQIIKTHVVQSASEALEHCVRWMESGLEGAIWKDRDTIFRDGTSPQQLKLKLEIEGEFRITGFKEGSVGTKREGRIGSIEFATDDGQVKGYASGFTDAQLDEMDVNRDQYLGKIMSVTFNDITRGRNSDYYALSHPRFTEIRNDKDETDTLERLFEAKKMAMELDE